MLTAEIIFSYVWQHFVSVYPEAKGLPVNYGANGNGKVSIENNGLAFLAQTKPFPENIYWRVWEGKKLPFLFPIGDDVLISETARQVHIHADVIAGAFYFLSGWQEYFSKARDKFNRFPYRESLQKKHNFVTLPVVNNYFEILKTALEKAYQITLKNPAWGNHAFITFLSHDIDRLESAWKVEGLKQLKKGNLTNFLKLGFGKISGRDHWHNLEKVSETVQKFGAVSTFFWLPQKGKFKTHPNADYDLTKPLYQEKLKQLAASGFENGVHGSFGSSGNAAQLKSEKEKISADVTGNRFHYLCYDPKLTPQVLAGSGLSYDCSLGFAEHFGFRNGYCFPFRPFDFSGLKPYPFLELPLNLMDATLWHPNYLKLKPEEILPAIKPMLSEIKKFGGCFGLLWHNENFSELNTHNGLAAFEEIMRELQRLNSGFKTGAEIATIFQDRI